MTTSFVLQSPTNTDRHASVLVAAIGSVLIALYPVGASDSIVRFSVGALVRPMARVDVRTAPLAVDVSATDIARGYVEVNMPMELEVQSNSRNGYVLNVMPRTNLFSQVQVRGLDGPAELGPDGGAVVQRWQPEERRRNLSLTYRFVLQQGVQPGSYPWPLQIDVAPL
jgi:hypothetical protein